MTVVPFRRTRLPSRFPRPVEPPPALGKVNFALRDAHADRAEDRRRMIENLGALLVVVVLLVLGAWLIDRLQAYSRTMACLEFGHRNCAKLDVGPPPSR